MDFESLFKEALISIGSVKLNSIFVLRNLFEGHRWDSYSKGDRLYFGKFFKRKVLQGNVPGVKYVGKAPNNSAQYQKTEEIK